MIELIMIILILGILAIVILPEISSAPPRVNLTAAKQKLQSDLRYAQLLAFTQQIDHGLIFDPATEVYSVYSQNTTNIIKDPVSQKAFTVDYINDNVYKGVGIVSTSFGSPTTNRVEFNNLGAPSDGTTALSADGTVTLTAGETNVTVTVTKNTGKVN